METLSLKENLLLEKIDEAELRNMANAFQRIDYTLNGIDMPSIQEPINQARDKITDMVTGAEKGLLKKVFKGFRQKKVLADVIGVQIQVMSLFRSLPNIMTLAGQNIKKSISGADSQTMKSVPPAGYDIPPAGNAGGELKYQGRYRGFEAGGSDSTWRGSERGRTEKRPLVARSGTTVADAVQGPEAQRMQALIVKSLQPAVLEKTIIEPSAVANDIMGMQIDDFSKLVQRASGLKLRVPISKQDMEALSDEVENSGTDVNQLAADLKDPDKGDTLKAALKALNQYDALKPEIMNIVKKL